MGYWSLYFIAKLALYADGKIDLHVWLNLALCAFTALLPTNERQRYAKNLLAGVLALALFYYDSWLPPLQRLLVLAPNLKDFSGSYLLELTGRLIDLQTLLVLLLLTGLYLLLRRKVRMATVAFAGLSVVAVLQLPFWNTPARAAVPAPATTDEAAAPDQDPDLVLRDFYRQEAKRLVTPSIGESGSPYDIIIVHVCSLGWDDLDAVGMAGDSFLKRFTVLFTHFSSAASYSGPAAIRLMRANCGQTPEASLYTAPQDNCLLITGLENAGFEPHWLLNHDGHFGNFFDEVTRYGGLSAPLESNAGAQVSQRAFDGTPVLSDYSVLSRWWQGRLRSGNADRVVLYYNTVSLHDGNRLLGAGSDAQALRFDTRAHRLFADLAHFMDDIRDAHRQAVVIFVAEHGGAVRGERRQIPGLREVPSPLITRVPVGIAFVGDTATPAMPTQRIDTPTSYLALATLLSRITASNPFDAADATVLAGLTADLPSTRSVAENADTVVMEAAGQHLLRNPGGTWSPWVDTAP